MFHKVALVAPGGSASTVYLATSVEWQLATFDRLLSKGYRVFREWDVVTGSDGKPTKVNEINYGL